MQAEGQGDISQAYLGHLHEQVGQLAAEVARMQGDMEHVMSDSQRARVEAEQSQNELQLLIRKTRALWVMVLLLFGALAAASVYGYPRMKEYRTQVEQLPEIQELIDEAYERIGAAEQTMGALVEETLAAAEVDRDDFSRRMEELERTVGDLQDAQGKGLTQRIDAIQEQITETASMLDADRARLTKLQNEVVIVRDRLASEKRKDAGQKSDAGNLTQLISVEPRVH